MHKTEKRAKESRMNLMYSYLCDRTLVLRLTQSTVGPNRYRVEAALKRDRLSRQIAIRACLESGRGVMHLPLGV